MRRAFGSRTLPALLVAGAVVTVAATAPAPAAGASSVEAQTIRLEAADDTTFQIGSRRYHGPIELTAYAAGIAVVEVVDLDTYLAGIREVPFSWPMEALATQAVAARTYLAWTLARGRVGDQQRYQYDICATSLCQVYGGAGVEDSVDGDRWLEAVDRTRGEILVADGAPAQALYSSSAGKRTRANQDIWDGEPKAYLQPVDSPEAGVTPFESWTVEFATEAFGRIIRRGGYDAGGSIRDVELEDRPEGTGPSRVLVTSEQGIVSIPVDRFRAVLNVHAPKLYPGSYPAARSSAGRWPQTVLSYSYDVEFFPGADEVDIAVADFLPSGDLPATGRVVVTGEGWGHAVGMSQWGSKAMADLGFDHREILSHYYSGLVPISGGDLVPDRVRVGLAVEQAGVTITTDGPFEVVIDGVPAGTLPEGEWLFPLTNRGIEAVPRFDLAPGVIGVLGRLRPR
jgi:stage II sporulation protein D